MSLNPTHGEVYSIHLTCDKVCHFLVLGRLFSRVTWVSSTNKTDRHHILLKVALDSILPLKGILSIHHLKNWYFLKHVRSLTILKTMLPDQCRVTGNCTFVYWLSLFIYLYALFKSYIEIISSTINVNKSNNMTGTK